MCAFDSAVSGVVNGKPPLNEHATAAGPLECSSLGPSGHRSAAGLQHL